MTFRKYISINSDGVEPTIVTVDSRNDGMKTIELLFPAKDPELDVEVTDNGSDYIVKFYKDGKVTKRLHLQAHEFADLIVVGTILAKHYDLCRTPETYELKV